MPLAIPAELKKIVPYIKRAEELDRDQSSAESRLVAYYCRQYAVSLGIPLAGSSAGNKACLGHILGDLEKEKPAMDNFTRDEASFLCRKFAEGIFNKADEEDRAGKAGKGTAKTFYAAATFLQMLEQFSVEGDENAAEDKKRIIYSKWKSTEILKAIKEGREPTPGGYGEDQETEEAEEEEPTGHEFTADGAPVVETIVEDDDENNLPLPPPAPNTIPPPVVPLPSPEIKEGNNNEALDKEDEQHEGTEVKLGPPPPYAEAESDRPTLTFDLPAPELPSTPSKKTGMFGFGKKKNKGGAPTKAQISDAVELTRFALAALEDKDVEVGAQRLHDALDALGRS